MSDWKKKIIDELINHYFNSSDADANQNYLRIRTSIFFPDFDSADPDEKDVFIETAMELERKQIVQLRWEKRGKGERLKTITCENFEALFTEAGKPNPKDEAEKIRTLLTEKVNELKASVLNENIIKLLEYFSINFSIREIGQGINQQVIEDFICYLEFTARKSTLVNFKPDDPSGYSNDFLKPEKITIRALSILLYNDSKRLENVLSVCSSLISRAQKAGSFSYINLPDRSFPEAMISGKIIFEYKNSNTPLVNAEGLIMSLPLESIQAISKIKPITEKTVIYNEVPRTKKILTIENKETFYALGSPFMKQSSLQTDNEDKNVSLYDCFLYTGGYPNRAVAAIIRILSDSGFSFYHAGDLDPDGILILQHIQNIAQKHVTPVRMDALTFTQYQKWARPLSKTMLNQIKKITDETKNIPELASLLQCIKKTGLGVEQEIIDYR